MEVLGCGRVRLCILNLSVTRLACAYDVGSVWLLEHEGCGASGQVDRGEKKPMHAASVTHRSGKQEKQKSKRAVAPKPQARMVSK